MTRERTAQELWDIDEEGFLVGTYDYQLVPWSAAKEVDRKEYLTKADRILALTAPTQPVLHEQDESGNWICCCGDHLTAPEGEAQPVIRRTIVCAACAMEHDEPLGCDSPDCDGTGRFVTAEQVYRHPAPPDASVEALREIKKRTAPNISPEKYIHRIARDALLTTEGET